MAGCSPSSQPVTIVIPEYVPPLKAALVSVSFSPTSLRAGGSIIVTATVKNIGTQSAKIGVMGWVYSDGNWVLRRAELYAMSGFDGADYQGGRVGYMTLAPGDLRQVSMTSGPISQPGTYGVFVQAGVLNVLTYSTVSFVSDSSDARRYDNTVTVS